MVSIFTSHLPMFLVLAAVSGQGQENHPGNVPVKNGSPEPSDDDKKAFQKFIQDFNMTFSADERGKRLGIFAQNRREIAQLKAAGAKGIGINKFAASTNEEFKSVSPGSG